MAIGHGYRLPFLLGTFFLCGILSAAIHPSPLAPAFLETLAGGCVLALILSWLPSRLTIPVMLATLTLVAVGTLVWIGWLHQRDLVAKSPLVARLGWLSAQAGTAAPLAISPNVPGMLAAIVGAGWIALARGTPRTGVRVAALCLAVGSLGVVVASGSRAGILALAAATLAVFLLGRPARVAIASLIVIGTAIGALALTGPGRDLMNTALADTVAANRWDSFERFAVWRGTLRAIAVSPVVGRGIGSFPVAYEPGTGPPDPVGAHSTVLQIAMDLGGVGVLCFLAMVGYFGWRAADLARRHPEGLILSGAGVAWLAVSVLESTVIGSWRQQEPWFGWQEVVTPLAFAFFGAAAAPVDRVLVPARRMMADALVAVIVMVSLPLTMSDAGWARPAGVSDNAVLAATTLWVSRCAAIQLAVPPDCPQAAVTGNPRDAFDWTPATPLLENTDVTWSTPMGLFIVSGNFNLRYSGDCPAAIAHDGLLHGYFVVGLRPAGDRRNFGAYALAPDTLEVAGFSVVTRYRWMTPCPAVHLPGSG